MKIKTYSELIKFDTFEERYEYLRIGGRVGEETFGHNRYLNQILYHSGPWRSTHDEIVIRDNACDLGILDRSIEGAAYVHHINPVTIEMILNRDPWLFDPENLISMSYNTHQAIHYGDKSLLLIVPPERFAYDTCPWRH